MDMWRICFAANLGERMSVDHTILITGASSGIGLASARRMKERGWRVLASARKPDDLSRLERDEGFIAIPLEQADPSSVDRAAAMALDRAGGRIDALFNNAAYGQIGALEDVPAARLREQLEVNVIAPHALARALIPGMRQRGFGRIVNIASLSALLAPLGQTNYAAAKAGVVALTQSLAKESARSGITVNAVCPGYVDTEALSEIDPEQRKALARSIPMRRFGKPEEIAAAVRFLASAEASYVTGAVLKIDGGIF